MYNATLPVLLKMFIHPAMEVLWLISGATLSNSSLDYWSLCSFSSCSGRFFAHEKSKNGDSIIQKKATSFTQRIKISAKLSLATVLQLYIAQLHCSYTSYNTRQFWVKPMMQCLPLFLILIKEMQIIVLKGKLIWFAFYVQNEMLHTTLFKIH